LDIIPVKNKFLALLLLLAAPCANAQLYDLSIDVQGGAYGSGTFSGILAYQNGSLAVNVSDPTPWSTPFTLACFGTCLGVSSNTSTVMLEANQGPTENLFLSFGLDTAFGSATGPTITANSVSMSNGFDQPAECGVAAYPPTYGPSYMTCVSATLTPVTATTFAAALPVVAAPELTWRDWFGALGVITLCGLVLNGRRRV
jgi:hypothetical protein